MEWELPLDTKELLSCCRNQQYVQSLGGSANAYSRYDLIFEVEASILSNNPIPSYYPSFPTPFVFVVVFCGCLRAVNTLVHRLALRLTDNNF